VHIHQKGNDNDCILESNTLEENVNIPQLRSVAPTSQHRGSTEAVQIRDKGLFCPGGSVPWQMCITMYNLSLLIFT
jgi:hypothetical protein